MFMRRQERKKIEEGVGLKVSVISIKEAKSTGKVIKAKPGKPGILVE